jgi:hypothetical protein
MFSKGLFALAKIKPAPMKTQLVLVRRKNGEEQNMRRSLLVTFAALSLILMSFVISDSPARAQQRRRPVTFDTGIVPLGMNQKLRLSVTGDFDGDGAVDAADYVVFRAMKYSQGVCSGAACKLVNVGTTTTGPLTLAAGEAATFELVATTYGRGIVTTNRKNVRVTASIINTLTGETTSQIIVANTDGDIH